MPPTGLNVQEGGQLTLNVGAEGTFPLTYLWHRDDTFLENNGGPFYFKNGVVAGDSGIYTAIITNLGGSIGFKPWR